MPTNQVIKILAMCMLLPWSLIVYVAWLLYFKPRHIHKPRSYGRIDLNKVKPCTIETNKQLSQLFNK